MLFNSPIYLFLFLPVVVVIYYRLARLNRGTTGKVWLVAASLLFYGYWNPAYLFLILGSVIANYGLVSLLNRNSFRVPKAPKKHRTMILSIGVLLNLGFLGYYKYSAFFLENINEFYGTQYPIPQIILPLAISFFTFQQIAYLVDCYSGKTDSQPFLDYVLFVTFFPQLIAGPIVHHREMMPQFQDSGSRKVNWKNICTGAFVFSIGLFKKAVIADSFAIAADTGFDTSQPLSMLEAWGTCLSYTLQIYYDFSGYTDMAIGAALLLNIHLPINFNSPYKALSFKTSGAVGT